MFLLFLMIFLKQLFVFMSPLSLYILIAFLQLLVDPLILFLPFQDLCVYLI